MIKATYIRKLSEKYSNRLDTKNFTYRGLEELIVQYSKLGFNNLILENDKVALNIEKYKNRLEKNGFIVYYSNNIIEIYW